MRIVQLETDAQISSAFPLMATLRDGITAETFVDEVRTQEADGYRLIAVFDDVSGDTQPVALAGARPGHTLLRGRHVFVDDLVTAVEVQGRGYATALLRWIAARALEAGIARIYLDARATAVGFYDQLHFQCLTAIPCWIECTELVRV